MPDSATGGWIYEYQSLVGGLAALLGALLTVLYLRRQVVEARAAANRAHRASQIALNREHTERLTLLRASLEQISKSVRALAKNIDAPINVNLEDWAQAPDISLFPVLKRTLDDVCWPPRHVKRLGQLSRPASLSDEDLDTFANHIVAADELVRQLDRLLRYGWPPWEIGSKEFADLEVLGPPQVDA